MTTEKKSCIGLPFAVPRCSVEIKRGLALDFFDLTKGIKSIGLGHLFGNRQEVLRPTDGHKKLALLIRSRPMAPVNGALERRADFRR